MKILLTIAFLGMFSAVALAEDKSNGCGLGWQVTNKTSFFATTTRGTTNAFVPPTFGMTSGTIGCSQHSFAKKDLPAATYAVTNFTPLSIEMAEGRGETLDGFARALGCTDAQAFGAMTQKQYQSIIGGKTDAVQMFENVKQQIRLNASLAKGCA